MRRFPASPEIYHAKVDNLDNTAIGEPGSAEAPDGSLRVVTEREAREVGLLSGDYRQILVPEQLTTYLEHYVGR